MKEASEMATDAAERIVGFLSHQEGVRGVAVATPAGAALASAGVAHAAKEAALAGFICGRADELAAEGDLRGMGKLVADSEFQQLTVSGPDGDQVVVRLKGACLLVSAALGQLATVAQSVTPVINRFGRTAEGR